MQNEIVNFKYSDSDFVTCLILNGYKVNYIEISEDKRNGNRLKAYSHITGNKEELIKYYNSYINGDIRVNPREFSLERKKLNKLIKIELEKYKLHKLNS